MKKVTLFIAMSLDGYIADSKGNVDWLAGQGNDDDNIDSYSAFVKEIDTVVMGWNAYVVTHNTKVSSESIRFVNDSPARLVKKLRAEEGKGIWICGGADLIRQLVREDIIDCYYITVLPTILGSGIRLFGENNREIKLKLLRTQSYNGMTDLIYERRIGE